jgi:hypothetical protein
LSLIANSIDGVESSARTAQPQHRMGKERQHAELRKQGKTPGSAHQL